MMPTPARRDRREPSGVKSKMPVDRHLEFRLQRGPRGLHLGRDRARSRGRRSLADAALRHEAVDHAIELKPVIELRAHQRLAKTFDRLRGRPRRQLDGDAARISRRSERGSPGSTSRHASGGGPLVHPRLREAMPNARANPRHASLPPPLSCRERSLQNGEPFVQHRIGDGQRHQNADALAVDAAGDARSGRSPAPSPARA